jgi:hypothetical protein
MLTVRRFIVVMVPVAAMCAMLAMSAGSASASASVNVVEAIHQQDAVVSASAALQRLQHLEATDKNDSSKLYVPIETLARKFAHSASIVSDSSADSAKQRLGRKDWVAGVREISAGFYKLGHAINDVRHDDRAAGSRLALEATKKVQAGQKLGYRADRLLGLDHGD